jgi:hypothetical protein
VIIPCNHPGFRIGGGIDTLTKNVEFRLLPVRFPGQCIEFDLICTEFIGESLGKRGLA